VRQLFLQGWKPIAEQKIPQSAFGVLYDMNVAIRIHMLTDPSTGRIIEHDPVLMHPKIADFILSRLAREISGQHRISSLTFDSQQVTNHMYDGRMGAAKIRTALLEKSLPIAIPDNVDRLSIGDYWGIRSEFQDVRDGLNNLLQELAIDYNLDDHIDVERFFEHLNESSYEIEKRVKVAQRNIGIRRFSDYGCFVFKMFSTLSGAAIGLQFGGMLPGLFGTGVGFLGGEAAHKLSTYFINEDTRLIQRMALMKGRINKVVSKPTVRMPNYLI